MICLWKSTFSSQDDTVRVLWALNNDRPRDFNLLAKHTAINRGARSIHMLYNQIEENFSEKMSRVCEEMLLHLCALFRYPECNHSTLLLTMDRYRPRITRSIGAKCSECRE